MSQDEESPVATILGQCGKLVGDKIKENASNIDTSNLVSHPQLGTIDEFEDNLLAFTAEDTDGDGVVDPKDAFPNDPDETTDTDGDLIGDNADAFPEDPDEAFDEDQDGIGDNADTLVDNDGDGVANASDAFPDDSTEQSDTDNDGVGDNADAFPEDSSEVQDTDQDGVGDNADAYPNDPSLVRHPNFLLDNFHAGTISSFYHPFISFSPNRDDELTADLASTYHLWTTRVFTPEKHGVPFKCWAFGFSVGEHTSENMNYTSPDHIVEGTEIYFTDSPKNPNFGYRYWIKGKYWVAKILDPFTETRVVNGRTYVDNFNRMVVLAPNPIGVDSDGDGVPDYADAFINDPLEWKDIDGDGIGDNSDPSFIDSDEDGYVDEQDDLPEDPTQFQDSDGDGYGDNPEGNNPDKFPDDSTEWVDTDGDLVGDNADYDPNNPDIVRSPLAVFDGWGTPSFYDRAMTGTLHEEQHNITHGEATSTPWRKVELLHDTIDTSENVYDSIFWLKLPAVKNDVAGDADPRNTGISGWAFTMHRKGDLTREYNLPVDLKVGDRVRITNGGIYKSHWNGYDWGNTEGYYWVAQICTNLTAQGGVFNIKRFAYLAGNKDLSDHFPQDDTQYLDSDGDGFGDNPDGNNPDLAPFDPYSQVDTDGDGVGDNTDHDPNDPNEYQDSDQDGVGDLRDTDPDNPLVYSNGTHTKLQLRRPYTGDLYDGQYIYGITNDYGYRNQPLRGDLHYFLSSYFRNQASGIQRGNFLTNTAYAGPRYLYFNKSRADLELIAGTDQRFYDKYSSDALWFILDKHYERRAGYSDYLGLRILSTITQGVNRAHTLVYNRANDKMDIIHPLLPTQVLEKYRWDNSWMSDFKPNSASMMWTHDRADANDGGGGNIFVRQTQEGQKRHRDMFRTIERTYPSTAQAWEEIDQDTFFVDYQPFVKNVMLSIQGDNNRNNLLKEAPLPLNESWQGYNVIHDYATFATDEIEPSGTFIAVDDISQVEDFRGLTNPLDNLLAITQGAYSKIAPTNPEYNSTIGLWLEMATNDVHYTDDWGLQGDRPQVGEKVKYLGARSLGTGFGKHAYKLYIPAQGDRTEPTIAEIRAGGSLDSDADIFADSLYRLDMPNVSYCMYMAYRVLEQTTPLVFSEGKLFILSDYWSNDLWLPEYEFLNTLRLSRETNVSHLYHRDANTDKQRKLVFGEKIIDADNDGAIDSNDEFPQDPSEYVDSDGDGVGDNADPLPNDPNFARDTDGDGVTDRLDHYPYDATKDGTGETPLFDVYGVYWTRERLDAFGFCDHSGSVNSIINLGRSIAVGDIIEVYYSDIPAEHGLEAITKGTYRVWKVDYYRARMWLQDTNGKKLNNYVHQTRGEAYVREGWSSTNETTTNYYARLNPWHVRSIWKLYKTPYALEEIPVYSPPPTNEAHYVYGDDGTNGLGYYYPVHLNTEGLPNPSEHIIDGITYYIDASNSNLGVAEPDLGDNTQSPYQAFACFGTIHDYKPIVNDKVIKEGWHYPVFKNKPNIPADECRLITGNNVEQQIWIKSNETILPHPSIESVRLNRTHFAKSITGKRFNMAEVLDGAYEIPTILVEFKDTQNKFDGDFVISGYFDPYFLANSIDTYNGTMWDEWYPSRANSNYDPRIVSTPRLLIENVSENEYLVRYRREHSTFYSEQDEVILRVIKLNDFVPSFQRDIAPLNYPKF